MPAAPPLPQWPTLTLERRLAHAGRVCGIDEAGYAPLAGPIVAAAVVLPPGPKPRQLRGLTDSKLLTARQREHFFAVIHRLADVGVGMATVQEIDRLNIFQADMLAMQRALAALPAPPDAALVDGRSAPPVPCPVETVVKGDRRSLSIAAASVVAKVVRDRLMQELAASCPGYGWHTNVGYGTDEHYLGLLRLGPTDHHRRSFAPLTTLFGADGPGRLRGFRFEPVAQPPERLELLALRQDLYAVFDQHRYHVGQVKHLRSGWVFQATGYDGNREPRLGAGPCARLHETGLPAPEASAVLALLAGAGL